MRHRHRRGSLLIVTTWLLLILSLLAISIGHRGQLEVRLVDFDTETLRTQMAARAGLQRALTLLQEEGPGDTLNAPWANNELALRAQEVVAGRVLFDVMYTVQDRLTGEPRAVYGIQDEQSRLHLNGAHLTAAMIAALPDMDLDVANAILAFRDETAEHPDEDAQYGLLQPPYRTKRAPFESMAELALVRGMTPARFQIASQYCTVYPTEGAPVNINTVSVDVLSVLRVATESGTAALSDTFLANLLTFREGSDGLVGTEDDRALTSEQEMLAIATNPEWPGAVSPDDADILQQLVTAGALGTNSQAVRIRVEGYMTNSPVRSILEAVVPRTPSEGEQSVLAWQWQ